MNFKPFVVVVICIFTLLVLASGAISETDLTPNTPPMPTSTPMEILAPFMAPAPVSGSACYTPYTVQSGDTLSRIAVNCGVSLSDLIAANPGLANPNLIYPGQELRIPSGLQPGTNALADAAATAAVQQEAAAPGWNPSNRPAGVLATGKEDPLAAAVQATAPPAAPTEAPAEQPAPTEAPAQAGQAGVEIPGHHVGDLVAVEILDVPASAQYRLSFGMSGGERHSLGGGSSDASGSIKLSVQIPPEARPGERWFVFAISASGQEYVSSALDIGGVP